MSQSSASSAKGRAVRARPLACLLTVGLSALACAWAAASASATDTPLAPVLHGTVPASPSTETRPAVVGGAEEGIVISGVGHIGDASRFPTLRETKNPKYLIDIYANACGTSEALLVGEGTAEQLESETGIQLSQELARDATTDLFAKQVDPVTKLESACSNRIAYQQVSTAPGPPVFSATVPASPAANNFPRLVGTVRAGSTVSIFTDSACSGPRAAFGSATEFEGEGIQVGMPDNTTAVFYAVAELAGLKSSCSTSSIEYQEVGGVEPPPSEEHPGGGGGGEDPGGGKSPGEELPNPPGSPSPPKLRTTPQGTANDNTPTVTGKAPGAARVEIFEGAGCRGDAVATGTAAQLGAGLSLAVADNSTVALYGVSIDGGGDRSSCTSNPVDYVEDSTPPHVRFTSGPGAKTRRPSVLFTFADTTADPSTTFQCRLDRRKWTACHSPLRLRHLGHRRHTLNVRGVDAAGNMSARAKRSFKVIRGT